MKDRRKEMRRDIIIDESHIKVTFEELFYDLIFVIIISKISSLVVEAQDITFGLIAAEIGLFLLMFYSWRFRLISNNQVHVLSNKIGERVASIKLVTYVEIVLLVMMLHNVEAITFKFMLGLYLIVMLASIMTTSQIKDFVFNYFGDDREKLRDVITKIRTNGHRAINIDYITERYGIVVVLFLGEVLKISFTEIDSNITLLVVLIIIISMFNGMITILEHSKQVIRNSDNKYRAYRLVRGYFSKLLINLLLIIVFLELSAHHNHTYPIILSILFIAIKLRDFNIKHQFNIDIKIFELIYYIALIIIAVWMPNLNSYITGVVLVTPAIYFMVKNNRKRHEKRTFN